MTSAKRLIQGSALAVSLGLAMVALLALILNAAPASATPDLSNHTSQLPIEPNKPTGPVAIPPGTAPTIDGACSAGPTGGEWSDALAVEFQDFGGVGAVGTVTRTVYLKHDNTNLYVCMVGSFGIDDRRFARVYLDTLDTKEQYAGLTDYALQARIIGGATSSYKGTGVPNGYTLTLLSGWTAATSTGNADVAEYQIPITLTGGACGLPFGLAVYHQSVLVPGDAYGWPSNQYFDQPHTWQEVKLDQLPNCAGKSTIAYIYKYDTVKADDFKKLLTSVGYGVDLIPLSTVTATNFTTYTELIVADDTGSLDQWGTALSQITPITVANTPILGLGEGGYAFFGKLGLFIGWPQGWHGPQQFVDNPAPAPSNYYFDPFDLSGLLGSHIQLYGAASNEVGIYVPGKPPANVTVLGWEPYLGPQGTHDHAPLISDGCQQLWGFSDSPTSMTPGGQRLFLNAVKYGYTVLQQSCHPTTPPPLTCVTLTKTAVPPSGSTVQPGDAIKYTLVYTVADNIACMAQRALLIDQLPDRTLFIPGSASDGQTPNLERTLIWNLSPLAPAATGSKTFAVDVLDTACRQKVITNTAKLQTELGTFTSNTTTHNVNCPPVIPPNNDPPYAESEIQVYPYPLVTGAPTHFSVRVFNNSATSQTVTVTFQTSPNNFGIGIPFATLAVPGNPRVVTIGPHGYSEVQINWTPDKSGHYCILVKIENPNYKPIFTYRNLDVAEDLRPGVEDVLPFKVGNPTTTTATIDLVVDNTCPGWTASVSPTALLDVLPNDTDIRDAELHVTPPNPATLGTACHIDVQGWIGDQLIGGIRKLDVPPINLPQSDPPWLEKEISTIPSPPISGTLNQVCIELNNPFGVTRTVTVTFSEAVFGAGIPFTLINPAPTYTFDLPPHSLQKYCVAWLPIASASLHHCLLVTLSQPGFQDQRSQRNVDLVRRPPIGWNPGSVHIPFTIGNPFPFDSQLDVNGILIGLNNWMPKFVPDPPPDLPPGGMYNGELMLVPAVLQHAPQNAPQAADVSLSGDAVRVDVSVNLNGQPASGFSVDFAPPLNVYLPLMMK